MINKFPIFFIVGPTAVGKSSVAFALANQCKAEIISCDAMQVYREVNIASDKPSQDMQNTVPHHLVDVVSVEDEFDVVKYRDLAMTALNDVNERECVPIFVGGSGMYVNVLLDGIFADVPRDANLRTRFEKLATIEGSDAMHARLKEVDVDAAQRIHPNDVKRIVRALEVFAVTGKPISQLQKKREGLWGTRSITVIGLTRDRAVLYKRAEERIDQMIENGLLEEIKNLRSLKLNNTAARMIGVPEIGAYLDGECDLNRALELMKRNTRHYIKRQLTWFRHDGRVQWIDVDKHDTSSVVDHINHLLSSDAA